MPLSLDFICFKCFAIVINPFSCQKCGVSYCNCCFENKIKRKNFCFCTTFSKEKFIPSNIPKLQDTSYTFYRNKDLNSKLILQYYFSSQLSLSYLHFEKIESALFAKVDIPENTTSSHEEFVNQSIGQLNPNISSNSKSKIKLVNFTCVKGCSLTLRNKFLSSKNTVPIQKLSLKTIDINKCIIPLTTASILGKMIVKNRKKLQNIYYHEEYKSNLQNFILFCKGVSSCTYLKNYAIWVNWENSYERKNNRDLLLYSNSLKNSKQLVQLYISYEYLMKSTNYDFIDGMRNLNIFTIQGGQIDIQALLIILEKLVKYTSISILDLSNKIMGSVDEERLNKIKGNLNILKFKIEEFTFSDQASEDKTADAFFYQHIDFIKQCKKLTTIMAVFYNDLKNMKSAKFAECFKQNKILQDVSAIFVQNVDKSFFDELFINYTGRNLSIIYDEINESYKEIVEFLKRSEKIEKIDFKSCSLEVDYDLIEAALLSKSLIELRLQGSVIKEAALKKMDKSCLKKIKMDLKYEEILNKNEVFPC